MSSDSPAAPPPRQGPPPSQPGPPPQAGRPAEEPARPPHAEPARLVGEERTGGQEPRSFPPQSAVTFTRTAAAWWALIIGSLTLIVLLVFIAQNLDSSTINFLGWRWQTPTGIALLVAAICGSLITVMTGAARMLQLRRAAKKNLRTTPPPRPNQRPN